MQPFGILEVCVGLQVEHSLAQFFYMVRIKRFHLTGSD